MLSICHCFEHRTLTTTSACSSGTQVAASRSHPPLLSNLLVDGSRSGQTLSYPFLMKLVAYCSFMFLAGTAMFLEKNFSYISKYVAENKATICNKFYEEGYESVC